MTGGNVMDASNAQTYKQRKQDAYSFLKDLEAKLNSVLKSPRELRAFIRKKVAESKTDESKAHLRLPESAFFNLFVVPTLSELVSAHLMDSSKAQQALLSEYKAMRINYCSPSGAPTRTEKHPFKKIMGVKAADVMRQWTSRLNNALTQSSPDICIREPFPFRVLFEGKYFERGGRDKAEKELVTSIYQAFFYLGLPYAASREVGSPVWDYEFACMLAGDASEEGSLQKAWEDIPPEVKKGFWGGSNIYVMIVRGASAKADP
jgi:hypothetical protein